MTPIHRHFSVIVLITFASAVWSQETPVRDKAANDTSPKFSAALVLIKADWSDSPYAKAIEAELREALKDASVPKELLANLPASGPEILFGPQTVALYSEEHHAELMAWLKAKELIVSQETFARPPLPPKEKAATGARSTAEQYVGYIDANKDGVLAKDEWLKWGGEYYRTADLDKNDILSLDELAAHILKEQRLLAENTIVLKKDDTFIDLPKTGKESRPFVKSQAELVWQVFSGAVPAGDAYEVTFNRQLTTSEQVRGQETPSVRQIVDHVAGNLHIKEGRVLVMNAFPALTEASFRAAAHAKGFEAVVMVGRKLDKTPDATARIHPPDWIDDRASFGHDPQLGGRGMGPPGYFGSSMRAPAGSEDVNTGRPTSDLKFTATFLLLKSDWSTVPAAKEIETELRAALKDVPVPKGLLENLPASGSQILFGGETAGVYEPQRFAELLAWLKTKDLVVAIEPLPAATLDRRQGPSGSALGSRSKGQFGPSGSSGARWNTSVTKGEKDFVDLSWITRPGPQPFVEYKPEVSLTIQSIPANPDDSMSITLLARTVEQSRGTPPGQARKFFESQIKYPFPVGNVAVTNAFEPGLERDLRAYIQQRIRSGGVEAFIVVAAGDKQSVGNDADPQLNLPDKVVTTQRTGWSGGKSSAAKSEEAGITKIIHLQHAAAPKLRDVILQIAPGEIKLAIDERTNAIIVSGSEGTLAELEAIVMRLDEPGSAAEDKLPPHPGGTVADLKQQYADAEQAAAALAKEAKPKKEKLRVAVAHAFEVRQKLLQAELAEFRQRTERIEQSLKQREGIKQQIIERRVEDLLKPGLEWDKVEAMPRQVPKVAQ